MTHPDLLIEFHTDFCFSESWKKHLLQIQFIPVSFLAGSGSPASGKSPPGNPYGTNALKG